MDKRELADTLISILCDYFGDPLVLEAFIDRWGIETLYNVISEILVGPEDDTGTDE